jgi:hypothetical protein
MKPYSKYWGIGYTPFSAACEYSIASYSDYFRWPIVSLYGTDVPSDFVPSRYWNQTDWRIMLDFRSYVYGSVPADCTMRTFFVYGKNGSLAMNDVVLYPGQGPYFFDIPKVGNWTYFYCYIFAVRLSVYGVYSPVSQCRFTGMLGRYDGVPW